MRNNPQLPAEILFAWLNGRADNIEIFHGKKVGEKKLLWQPEDAICIEQAILNFCDENNIDIRQEAEPHVVYHIPRSTEVDKNPD